MYVDYDSETDTYWVLTDDESKRWGPFFNVKAAESAMDYILWGEEPPQALFAAAED